MAMRRVFASVVVPGLLLGVLGVAWACSPPQTAGALRLDRSDDGHQVELHKGQSLEVNLEANPTTGYEWQVEDLDEQILRAVGEAEFKPQSNLIGAPGVQTLRFQAVGVGHTMLKLIYHRRWEKGVKPLQTYSTEVSVR